VPVAVQPRFRPAVIDPFPDQGSRTYTR
jgi:hypothetical protein